MKNDDRNIIYKSKQYRFAEVTDRWMPYVWWWWGLWNGRKSC